MNLPRIVSLALLTMGALTLAAGGFSLVRRIRHIESWHATDARLVSSLVVPSPTGVGSAAQFEFWYTVNGVSYTRTYTSDGGLEQEVSERAARRSTSSLYTIFYDPADPNRFSPNLGYNGATLGRSLLLSAIGLALVLFGASLQLLARSARQAL